MKKIYAILRPVYQSSKINITTFDVIQETFDAYTLVIHGGTTQFVLPKNMMCDCRNRTFYNFFTSYNEALLAKRKALREQLDTANRVIKLYKIVRRRLTAEIKATYTPRRERNKKRGGES